MSPSSRLLLVVAWLIPVGVLVQAALAGQSWFAQASLIGMHGGLGHGVLVLGVLTAALAWLLRASRLAASLATLCVVGLVAQVGLGYTGARGGIAAASALHVPLGVALVGVSVAVATLLSRPPVQQDA